MHRIAIAGARGRRFPIALLLSIALLLATGATWRSERSAPVAPGAGAFATFADDLHYAGAAAATEDQTAGNTYAVPWNGVMWQSMPNFTWSACDVSANTRRIIDLAIGQWTYAAMNQGLPIHLTEAPCTDSATPAQIRLIEATSRDLASLAGSADVDVFGLTLVRDTSNHICGIEVMGPCSAQLARVYLFTDNWAANTLSDGQAAKTTAHEIGHAIGLGHAHFCNYDSIMAQNCEPILKGLGPDDVESLDALVDHVRAYFNQPTLNVQPPAVTASGTGVSVIYHAGWNLVAGPRGTSFAASSTPLSTLLPGDTTYRSQSTSQKAYAGYGYWAYFPQDTTVQLNGGGGPFYSIIATPGKWFLVGNDNGATPMRVLGANSILTYDTQAGQYRTTTMVPPGQAAWVRAGSDSVVALAANSLTRTQLDCYENYGNPSSC